MSLMDGAARLETSEKRGQPEAEYWRRLNARHLGGAYVRSAAALVMWLFCLGAKLTDIIGMHNFVGVTAAVAYLVLINPPTLWILKRIHDRTAYHRFSLLINVLEIIGYTAIIHSLGGIESTYLVALYAALVTYVGVVSPRRVTFIVAGMCSLSFATLVLLERWEVLPSSRVIHGYSLPWENEVAILLVTAGCLYVVAYIVSRTSLLLRQRSDQIRVQAQELQRALNTAQEADRSKSEFLANVSHELRTPLNAIIGFSEILDDKHFGELNEVQADYVREVLNSARHLLSLINDILDLSKVEAGKMEMELGEVGLRGLVDGSLMMVRGKALNSAIQFHTELAGAPEVIHADERKLKQVIYNLLSNAVKFTSKGGHVALRADLVRRENGEWIDGEGKPVRSPALNGELKEGDWVRFSVEDTGIGIDPGDLERIFEPFVQADGSASRAYEGTGLGLALSRKLIELHGGRIWAESEGKNKGSRFTMTIPVGETPPPQAEPGGSSASARETA